MSINTTMPALSPTLEEGTPAQRLAQEGDTVSSGDILAEIETDQATMEVEAVDDGAAGYGFHSSPLRLIRPMMVAYSPVWILPRRVVRLSTLGFPVTAPTRGKV